MLVAGSIDESEAQGRGLRHSGNLQGNARDRVVEIGREWRGFYSALHGMSCGSGSGTQDRVSASDCSETGIFVTFVGDSGKCRVGVPCTQHGTSKVGVSILSWG